MPIYVSDIFTLATSVQMCGTISPRIDAVNGSKLMIVVTLRVPIVTHNHMTQTLGRYDNDGSTSKKALCMPRYLAQKFRAE